MAIQHPAARDDQFQAHAIGHRLRRDVTPEECYQCESAYQYVRQMQRNEKLCADDAFYDLYSSCVGCIEGNVNSGSPREYVEPNLGRYVDYCAQFTALTKWASMGATSATSATVRSTKTTSAQRTDGTLMDEASITGRNVEQLETSVAGTINTNPLTTTEVAQPEDSASLSNILRKNSSSSSKAWIAGAVVPSVLFVTTAVSFAIWWQRRRNRTPKTPKSPYVDDVAGTSRFDKPELDSQVIPRPRSKEEAITSTRTTVLDTVVLPVPAKMPENGLNRA
ncbi:Sodium/potassium-transporting ATPase subunit alpha-1 [Fusarium oxysporum f. sp. albedinis]|nr:Sodium/potassium-transporting ATPase subunit alpha-1 [Fusarium oxysporum f. sp. albedinis]